jgi:hypothetical protein
MRIIGFNFSKIDAERKNPIKGKLEIKSNLEIVSIEKEELELAKNQLALKFNFKFSVRYEPEFANINLEGFTLVSLEEKKAGEIVKHWKKKKIPEEIKIPLFNFILSKSSIRALQLEEEFGLPPHIPFPKINPQKENSTNYTN